MRELTVPVLLDDFGGTDIIQALKTIQGMETGQSVILCKSSPKANNTGVVVQSLSGLSIGRITPTTLDRVKAKHGAYLPLSACFDKELMSGFQIKFLVEEGIPRDTAAIG